MEIEIVEYIILFMAFVAALVLTDKKTGKSRLGYIKRNVIVGLTSVYALYFVSISLLYTVAQGLNSGLFILGYTLGVWLHNTIDYISWDIMVYIAPALIITVVSYLRYKPVNKSNITTLIDN